MTHAIHTDHSRIQCLADRRPSYDRPRSRAVLLRMYGMAQTLRPSQTTPTTPISIPSATDDWAGTSTAAARNTWDIRATMAAKARSRCRGGGEGAGGGADAVRGAERVGLGGRPLPATASRRVGVGTALDLRRREREVAALDARDARG